MAPSITRNGWIRIATITAVGLFLLPFSPGVKQQRNLRLAETYATKLRPSLQGDARFRHVRLVAHPGAGGSLLVSGRVEQATDKEALGKLVMAGQPPVQVRFMVIATAPEAGAAQAEEVHAKGN